MNSESNPRRDAERLTAYLLDELDAAGKSEVESRAATDLEFAERRDRLSATIELVRENLVRSEQAVRLSPVHHQALRVAASQRGRLTLHPVRSALAASLMLGCGIALYRSQPHPDRSGPEVKESLIARITANPVGGTNSSATLDSALPTSTLDLLSLPIRLADSKAQSVFRAVDASPDYRALNFVVPNPTNGSAAIHYKFSEIDSLSAALAANSGASIIDSLTPSAPTLSTLSDGSGVDPLRDSLESTGVQPFSRVLLQAPVPDANSTLGVQVSGRRPAVSVDNTASLGFNAQQVPGLVTSLSTSNDIPVALTDLVASNRLISVDELRRSCERRPGERPRDMYYRFFQDNAFERASEQPLSTFAADTDTASYTLARKYLADGYLPEKAQVRTEEFLNWFRPDVAAPTTTALAVHLDLAPSPFGGDDANRRMLRVVLRSRDLSSETRPPQRLMLVIDTSGSMAEQQRLELVKHQLRLLAAKLEPSDQLGIVRFAEDAALVLPLTPLSDRVAIERAVQSLTPAGSTNACAGIRLGCQTLVGNLDREATNHVVVFSDGVANTGTTDADAILGEISELRKKNLYLSTIGVGMNNHNDALLERLADAGDGSCAYVDSDEEAQRAIVDRFSGAFVPVARDVKIQVEFDPGQVERYRLIGYENRPIADQDFTNDAVDAGEIGSNLQVTALYEIEPTKDYGKYERPFATARVRWLPPLGQGEAVSGAGASISPEQEAADFDSATLGFRRACLVAQFAEFLRRSSHAENDSFDRLLAMARELAPRAHDPEFDEFVALLERSRDLIVSTLTNTDPLRRAIDALRRNAVLRAEIQDAARGEATDVLKQIEEENRRLEELLKKLLGER